MSLTISISTPYGIVLAADSRQTTTIFAQGIQIPRIGSDSATKIFNVPGRPIGITAAGPAFLPDPSNPHGAQRSIGSIIGDYLSGLETTKTVEEVHNGLVDYLEGVYTKPQVKMMEAQLLSSLPQGTKLGKTEQQEGSNEMIIRFTTPDDKNGEAHAQLMPISIIVTGYDKEAEDKFLGKTFVSHVPGGNTVKRAAA
ncbi:hypothetical protein KGQ71_03395, partial [Patescibacteria group bacterium]|nr:hypothetical protein [Patescibacteria group bacterium]